MNNKKFHASLVQPIRLGSQFNNATEEIVETVADEFSIIDQRQNDGDMNGTDVTEHTRKKHKHELMMDETVSAHTTKKKCL